jgi:transposase
VAADVVVGPSGPADLRQSAGFPRPPTPTGENVKLIPLTEGFYAYVDAADFEQLNQYRWYTFNGYAARSENGKRIYMHRHIMDPPQGMVVDHINHNRYDNTRANLRNVTQGENIHNMRKHVGGISVYKGVGRDRRWGN